MSGGSFNYVYNHVAQFADELHAKILESERDNKPSTLARLREIERRARKMAVLMKEAEWLYSGDTSDDSFMQRTDALLSEEQKEGMVLTPEEMKLTRQWFNCCQDVQPAYLEQKDYALARRTYKLLGMRVPDSIENG